MSGFSPIIHDGKYTEANSDLVCLGDLCELVCDKAVVFSLNKAVPDVSDVLHKGFFALVLRLQHSEAILQHKDLFHIRFGNMRKSAQNGFPTGLYVALGKPSQETRLLIMKVLYECTVI